MNENTTSDVTKDDILYENTESRPIQIPNAIIGYFGDLILSLAKYKVKTFTEKDSR
jgi:hypothetical protein